jgi:hypothetical protein
VCLCVSVCICRVRVCLCVSVVFVCVCVYLSCSCVSVCIFRCVSEYLTYLIPYYLPKLPTNRRDLTPRSLLGWCDIAYLPTFLINVGNLHWTADDL